MLLLFWGKRLYQAVKLMNHAHVHNHQSHQNKKKEKINKKREQKYSISTQSWSGYKTPETKEIAHASLHTFRIFNCSVVGEGVLGHFIILCTILGYHFYLII